MTRIIRRLKKACSCRASASGPRLVIESAKPYGVPQSPLGWIDTVEATVRMVELACDNCDKEWEEVE